MLGRVLLLDADEGPLNALIATISELVDDRFRVTTPQHTIKVMNHPDLIKWTSGGGCHPETPGAPLGFHVGRTIELRSALFDRVAVFMRGELSSRNPIVEGLEQIAVPQAVLGLRVLLHERIHAAQAAILMGGSNRGSDRVILEGATQLATDALLPDLLEATHWPSIDERVLSLPLLPVYPAETAAMRGIVEWAAGPPPANVGELTLEVARIARVAPRAIAMLASTFVEDAVKAEAISSSSTPLSWGVTALRDIKPPRRLPSGEYAESAAERRAFGEACAARAIAEMERLIGVATAPRPPSVPPRHRHSRGIG